MILIIKTLGQSCGNGAELRRYIQCLENIFSEGKGKEKQRVGPLIFCRLVVKVMRSSI